MTITFETTHETTDQHDIQTFPAFLLSKTFLGLKDRGAESAYPLQILIFLYENMLLTPQNFLLFFSF